MTAAEPVLQPDEAALPEPESPYGPRNEDLPKQLERAIRSAITKSQNQERYLRRLEVLHDRRNRFYERGHQHIYEGRDDCFVLAIPGATFTDADGNTEEWGDYIDDYPIFHGFLWIIQSVLTQNGPGIDFQPVNPANDGDRQAAETAEGLRKHFDRVNDTRRILREVVRMLALSGRTVCWVRTEENAAKWGLNPNGTPKKNQVAEIFGSLETKVPIMLKDQCSFPYLIVYKDADVRNAKQDHPHIRDKIAANESGLDENNYERFARLGVLQGARSQFQAGESISHMVTELHCWLRPSVFSDEEYDDPFEEATNLVPDEETGEMRTPTVREVLKEIFGDQGLHAVYVGKTYSQAWPEAMDDCLTTVHPFVGDGQFSIAIMDPAVIAQDRFNTLMNYIAETFDFGAPSTWVVAQKVDFEAMRDQRAQPYDIRQLKALAPNVNSAADMFWREPDPNVPVTLNQVIQFLFGEFLQFVLASPPSMWGDSTPDTKTASGLAQSRNQALGRMGILWSVLQHLCARMYYQVALAAKNDPDTPEEIIVPETGGPNLTVRVAELQKGSFMTRPDEDSGFPDSTAAKRATLMAMVQMIAQFPPAAQQFFAAPANWKEMLELLGIPEMVLPEAEAHDKQVAEIAKLLDGVPHEPTQAEVQIAEQQAQMKLELSQQAGLPPPAPFDPLSLWTSSIPVNPWDFDQWEMEACDDYLNSNSARQTPGYENWKEALVPSWQRAMNGQDDPQNEELGPNLRGIANVWLHRQEHAQAMALKQPPMPPVPVVAPKGGAPKPGGGPAPVIPAARPGGSPGTQTV